MVILPCAIGFAALLVLRWWYHRRATRFYRNRRPPLPVQTAPCRSGGKRKPAWALEAVVELKAACPEAGVRVIAALFNQAHAPTVTVCKSWVDKRLRENAHRVIESRRDWRRKKPRPVSINATWGLDLTFIRGQAVLGIIDHGSRRLLRLAELPRKCTWTLLGHLCLTIAEFGRPRAVRTDNESMFVSRLWKRAFALASVRRQRSLPGRPWQNGRIERLFGTIKPSVKARIIEQPPVEAPLQRLLDIAAIFYNDCRPHQALNGLTPRQAWDGITWKDFERLRKSIGAAAPMRC